MASVREVREDPLPATYVVALAGLLLGYSVIGKGFAYIGVAPVFVGEALLLAGVVVLLQVRGLRLAMTVPANIALAMLMGWTLLRTLPYLQSYGADALRDSATIMYGLFALVVSGLILADARTIERLVGYYGRFALVFPPAVIVSYVMSRYFPDHLPELTHEGVPIIQVRPGEVAVHVAGIALFAMTGLARLNTTRVVLLLVLAAMVVSANRGALLAIAIPLAAATLALRQFRQLALVAVVGASAFAAAYALEATLTQHRAAESSDERSVSPMQIVENAAGILGPSSGGGQGTKEWREQWWRTIIDETVNGPRFWTGRGFGVNLAQVANVAGWNPNELPPLRSPHNVNMTILARAGVPGLALWGVLLVTWFGAMARGMGLARARGQPQWRALFVFLAGYVLAILIDASFDVALEGPMVGIWFWCLIGFGCGALVTHRLQFDDVAPRS